MLPERIEDGGRLGRRGKVMEDKLFRCTKLHLTTSLKGCESMRSRKGSLVNDTFKPPQCNGCEDWKEWGPDNAVTIEPTKEEKPMPSKTPQLCQGCGETKTLLSKTHCHQCCRDQKKAEKRQEQKTARNGETPPAAAAKAATPPAPPAPAPKDEQFDALQQGVLLDFEDDKDLFAALEAEAHRNYRSLSGEIFAALRKHTGVDRPGDPA